MREKIIAYLASAKTMQVATSTDAKPWICTVYFVFDEALNLFWLSWPSRRHSRELAENSKAAVAIQIKTDQPVIGVQAEGDVELVEDLAKAESVMKIYTAKYGSGKNFVKNLKNNKNQHQMYKFTPQNYVLFDELNYPKKPRRELKLSK